MSIRNSSLYFQNRLLPLIRSQQANRRLWRKFADEVEAVMTECRESFKDDGIQTVDPCLKKTVAKEEHLIMAYGIYEIRFQADFRLAKIEFFITEESVTDATYMNLTKPVTGMIQIHGADHSPTLQITGCYGEINFHSKGDRSVISQLTEFFVGKLVAPSNEDSRFTM